MSEFITPPFSRQRQRNIFTGGFRGTKPSVPTSFDALEAEAKAVMSQEAFAYVAGGAGTGSTIDANRKIFNQYKIHPRMLRNVSQIDTSVQLFDTLLPTPFMLAPIGVLEMAHSQADLAVAQAAAAEQIPFIFSSQASVDMETCAQAMGTAPRWFQLYWSKNNELVKSFVKRAEQCGCEAIVLTLDTTMLGWRPQDLDLAYLPFLRAKGIAQYISDPVFRKMVEKAEEPNDDQKITLQAIRNLVKMSRDYPGSFWTNFSTKRPLKAVKTFIDTYSRPSLTWDELSYLRDLTSLPILLKGILDPEDAQKAVDQGMDGIIVSNHGGRQVDGAISALEMLPKIADKVGSETTVLFDSGIRSGSDILKALALGADSVLIGRPYVYGLALNGLDGVRKVIQNFRADFELNMGLSGCRNIQEITANNILGGNISS